jgi:putative polymerase
MNIATSAEAWRNAGAAGPFVAKHPTLLKDSAANRAAAVLMAATVLFNAVLSLINAHVIGIGGGTVAIVQAFITFAAIGVVLAAKPPGMARWMIYGWFAMTLWVLLTLVRSQIDPKIAGDILLVPAFAALGLCIARDTLFRTILVLQGLLFAFAILELFFPSAFGDLFKVRNYYVATRGFSDDVFWADQDNLFLSSQRPGGRIFTLGLAINRGASLFLEPVTLGNWAVVVSIALAAFWRDVTTRTRWLLIVSNVLLLIACDGRLAFGVCALILLTMPVFSRFPRQLAWAPVLYLPIMFVLLLIGWSAGYLDASASYDDLRGRYANSINFLMSSELKTLLGAANFGGVIAADSGWLHIIITQSILGLSGYWIAITMLGGGGPRSRRFAHAAGIFFAFALPVSYSILSIKSAALLWMTLGAAYAHDRLDREQGPIRAP